MLTEVIVFNSSGAFRTRLPLRDRTGPYFIKNIDGHGPVPAQMVFSEFAESDGEYFQDAKVRKRNLVFTIGYRPDYANDKTIEDVRHELYAFLPPKASIRLRFMNDRREPVEIYGRVETHEPDIFTQEPQVQVSVLCDQPYFRALAVTQIDGVSGGFITTNYPGTGTTDLAFRLYIDRNISQVTIRSGAEEDIIYNGGLQSGDILLISTTPGSKSIRRTRGGSTASVLNGLVGGLSMMVGPENPNIQVLTAGGSVPLDVRFNPKYVGL